MVKYVQYKHKQPLEMRPQSAIDDGRINRINTLTDSNRREYFIKRIVEWKTQLGMSVKT